MRIYNWNSDKNQELILGRNVSFEEVIFHIDHGDLLDDIAHPNASDYPNQRIFIVCIKDYVYLVPYVESEDEVFLKTIIPSRKFTKLYLGGKS
ncbi:MAG: toxin [Sedimenticola sp.]